MSPEKTITIWMTGLSGAGKSRLTHSVVHELEKSGKSVCVFDGDEVRQRISRHLSFTPEDIRENNRIVAQLCLENQGKYDYIFVPLISPFEDSRAHARRLVVNGFYLVYIRASLEKVIQNDIKGLYKKALQGEIKNFIGIAKEVPFEEPKSPDLVIDTDHETVADSAGKLICFLQER